MADFGEPPNLPPAAARPSSAKTTADPSPAICAVLVPVGHAIEPACESALRELEARGYQVRRAACQDSIDLARSELATAALREGFAETLWIDPDVGFHPDDVERLRSPGLPLVCGICPRPGRREIAAQLLPGTGRLVFGGEGGLAEIKYGSLAFMLVRREVFEKVQRQFGLPLCNVQQGRPLVPFFAPLWKDDAGGPSYLGPDFSFCERARQCGCKVHADTTIRLWRIAAYHYGWEDVWLEPRRFRTFHVQLGPKGGPQRAEDDVSPDEAERLNRLRERFPWPPQPPQVPRRSAEGWLHESTRNMLRQLLSERTRLIVEVGSWLGLSTRFFADEAPHATVIAIDHWKGSSEHQQEKFSEILPVLFETFLLNCWEYRQRIVPLRTNSTQGLKTVAEFGLTPDLVYIDADHTYEAVAADLETTLDLFPNALIVGDDWNWPGVEQAVREVGERRRRPIDVQGVAWRLG